MPEVNAAVETDPLVGRTVNDRYRILEQIGHGGMGRVYKARQAPIDRLVALKVLGPGHDRDPNFYKRFFLEASVTAKLTHPNTITLYDYGRTDDGIFFIAMEYLNGRTLSLAMQQEGALLQERVIHIAQQICRSLREAHALGIIHRDLKPANVMLLRQHDDHDFVKVLDFGLVKFFNGEGDGDPDITNAGTFMGSPHYIAPEQARNQNPDQRCDIYSLGVVLYQMLTGRVPFTAPAPVDIILKHLHEEPVPPKRARPDLDIDPSLQEIVLRCLSKSREARFQSMDELLLALKRVRSQVTGLASQSSMPPLGWADSSPAMNAMLPGQTPSSAMRTPSQPMSAMPTPGSGSHHLSRPPPPPDDALEELQPVRSFPAAAVVVSLLLLLAAGAGFALYRRALPAPAPAIAAVAEKPAPNPVAAEPSPKPDPNAGTTLVQVASDPEGAEVRDDAEHVVGTTPFELRVPSGKALQLGFRRDGFRSATVKRTFEGERTALSVTLKKNRGAAETTHMGKRSVGYKDDPY